MSTSTHKSVMHLLLLTGALCWLCLCAPSLVHVQAGRIRLRAVKSTPETAGLTVNSDSRDYTNLEHAMAANVPTTAPTVLPPSGLTATTP